MSLLHYSNHSVQRKHFVNISWPNPKTSFPNPPPLLLSLDNCRKPIKLISCKWRIIQRLDGGVTTKWWLVSKIAKLCKLQLLIHFASMKAGMVVGFLWVPCVCFWLWCMKVQVRMIIEHKVHLFFYKQPLIFKLTLRIDF